MKSVIGNAIILGLAVAVGSTAWVGCSNGVSGSGGAGQNPGEENTGTVGMQLTLPGGEHITTVTYTISGPHSYTGSVNVSGSSSISFALPGIAAGSGYTITLSATSDDGTVSCVGTSAPFTVTAQQTTAVSVFLQCTSTGSAADAGGIVVTGVPVNCATWTSAIANPSSAPVGGVVALAASATGPNAAGVTYAWTAPTGAIDTPSLATANFTCPATAGAIQITLTVGDGALPTGATCPAAGLSTVLTVTCTGGAAVDSGTPAPDSGTTTTPDSGTTTKDSGTTTVDAGPPPACTAAGQTNCVACSGNTNGVCSPTEALFVQHDINAGHSASLDCYSCLFNNSCIDDTAFSDTNHECSDVPASSPVDAGGSSEPSLCLSTISCVLSTSCAGPNDGAGAAAGVSICYCGPTNAGTNCQTAAAPNGLCATQEVTGLGLALNANPTVLKDYNDTTRPSGMANQIFACASTNGCAACLQ
jgi:hypothetical protein